jgi:hypothetical protein
MNGQNKEKNTLNLKTTQAKFVLETSNNTSPASGQNTATNRYKNQNRLQTAQNKTSS